MSAVASFNGICRFVYSEPKFLAELEWHAEYGFSAQLEQQVPRDDLEAYLMTGQHPNPDRRISFVLNEMPDFDWWEPRYDQPGRREQTRKREAGL